MQSAYIHTQLLVIMSHCLCLQAVIVNIIKVNAEWEAQGTREGSKENIREGEGEGWKKGVLVSTSFAINSESLTYMIHFHA